MTRLLPFLALIGFIYAVQNTGAEKFVTGKVTFNGPKDIQAGSRVEIQLQDTSLMDTAAKVIGTTTITDAKSFPIAYRVKYNPSQITRGHTYSMSVRITGPGGQLHYINDMHIKADVSGATGPTVDAPVIKVGGSPSGGGTKPGGKACPPVNCHGKKKTCPYGYQKNKDGCDICKCNDPCNPQGKAKLCGPNQKCHVEKKLDGTFGTRCDAAPGKKGKQDKHSGKVTKADCNLSKVTGPCRAAHRRFYYDSATKSCQMFTYGGCQGNANNFNTKMECEKLCKA